MAALGLVRGGIHGLISATQSESRAGRGSKSTPLTTNFLPFLPNTFIPLVQLFHHPTPMVDSFLGGQAVGCCTERSQCHPLVGGRNGGSVDHGREGR